MSRKATATKSLKEKCSSRVQSARENGENEIGGFSTVTSGFSEHKFGDDIQSVRLKSSQTVSGR